MGVPAFRRWEWGGVGASGGRVTGAFWWGAGSDGRPFRAWVRPARAGMTQHRVMGKIGALDVQVMAGWDRPLQLFFLDVVDPAAEEDEDEEVPMLYCSMYDPRLIVAGRGSLERPFAGLGFEELKARLVELCVDVPESFLEVLAADCVTAAEPSRAAFPVSPK